MTIEPVDKYFGVSLSDWIERIPNELEMDAVGLWQIVPVGKDSFELEGNSLSEFVRRSIVALLVKGAVPVRPSSRKDKYWELQPQYGSHMEEIANNIISEWESSGRDPDEDGLWFTLLDE